MARIEESVSHSDLEMKFSDGTLSKELDMDLGEPGKQSIIRRVIDSFKPPLDGSYHSDNLKRKLA